MSPHVVLFKVTQELFLLVWLGLGKGVTLMLFDHIVILYTISHCKNEIELGQVSYIY